MFASIPFYTTTLNGGIVRERTGVIEGRGENTPATLPSWSVSAVRNGSSKSSFEITVANNLDLDFD